MVAGQRLVRVKLPVRTKVGRKLTAPAAARLERLLGFDHLNELYARAAGAGGVDEFLRRVLAELDVTCHLPVADLARVPRTGPAVVVANHPFGALDGVLLAAALRTVRPDVKIMVNYGLRRVEEMRELFILVDPFGGRRAARRNVGPMREAVRWVEGGGLLAVFPAGEVAHWRPGSRRVEEPAWSETVGRIVRRAGAPVVPVYFEGRNSALFHAAGLVHPRLRTALLARELVNKSHRRVTVRVGSAVPSRRLAEFGTDGEMTEFLRQRTLMLRHRSEVGEAKLLAGPKGRMEPIVEAVDPAAMEAELAALPSGQVLAASGESMVYFARAGQIPSVLREIGRLRELTFRATGEGTGRAIDLDSFDYDYVHLFLWDRKGRRVVGAYRLGATDEILPAKGRQGLYTSTLFDYREGVLERLTPGLELGRSFVRQEDQRGFTPLLLLWRGVCAYVVRNPRYRMLFGPVSISNDYQTVSKQLMVRFLTAHHGDPRLAGMVRPRNPFELREIDGCEEEAVEAMLRDGEDASALVAELEPDEKGMPVLVRQYLKLGAEYVAFNVDPAFGDCVDGLIVVDLARADVRQLDRYMGREGREAFLAHHAAAARRGGGLTAAVGEPHEDDADHEGEDAGDREEDGPLVPGDGDDRGLPAVRGGVDDAREENAVADLVRPAAGGGGGDGLVLQEGGVCMRRGGDEPAVGGVGADVGAVDDLELAGGVDAEVEVVRGGPGAEEGTVRGVLLDAGVEVDADVDPAGVVDDEVLGVAERKLGVRRVDAEDGADEAGQEGGDVGGDEQDAGQACELSETLGHVRYFALRGSEWGLESGDDAITTGASA